MPRQMGSEAPLVKTSPPPHQNTRPCGTTKLETGPVGEAVGIR